jgi:DNA polymerase-3 subunit alpha
MVEKLRRMGHDAIAVTEHGNLYSLVRANKACHEAGIKHIIGCEFYVAPHSRFDKQSKKGDVVYNHLIVLAKDRVGYEQIIRMCSLGFSEGFYYKPRIDEELLFGTEPGHLVVTTACIGSAFAQSIFNGSADSVLPMLQ